VISLLDAAHSPPIKFNKIRPANNICSRCQKESQSENSSFFIAETEIFSELLTIFFEVFGFKRFGTGLDFSFLKKCLTLKTQAK
jgi:hypothetical protein